MELNQIKAYLDSPEPQNRMKAIVELRHYIPEVVVPLLKQRMYDKELIVRSFVAMGLGYKQTDEGFDALLQLIVYDNDANVRAEAANSLAKYGDRSIPYLRELFERESHWLIRQSILAAMTEMDRPDLLLQMCRWGLEGDDLVVKLASIANLGELGKTPQAWEALEILLDLANNNAGEIRAQVVTALRNFDDPRAKTALVQLRQDSDYRVIAATLEALL
jgi:HEAT repeat protein